MILFSFASLVPTQAADVEFDGFYRARFRAFDSLSLESPSENSLALGLTALAQHRLMLEPRFLISDKVALFVQIKGLDDVPWGDTERAYTAFNKEVAPNVIEYDLASPASPDTNVTPSLFDLTLWRAWGEVYTPIGQFTFGRVPLMWGQGIWQNDGIHIDPLYADFGDTTDRLMWEDLIQDQFYLRLNLDVPAENFLDRKDHTTAFGLALGYRTEDVNGGLYLQLDHTGPEQAAGGALNVFSADGTASVTLGKLNVAGEIIGQFGGGSLPGGLNNTNITAFGGVLDATLTLDDWKVRARGGAASGDSQPLDENIRTFTFDRDYSVGLFMFEQPLPTFGTNVPTSANGGLDFSQVVTGNALSNAVFFKPTLSRRLVDGLWVDASWLGAEAARWQPTNAGTKQHRGYGSEIQLGATYDGIEHFQVDGRGAVFIPGSVYSESPNGQTQTGFNRPAYGFQVTGTINF